jgi:anti-sigma factor RsiW
VKVTREVIYDLLPAYFAGDASDDTRALVEAYFETDPEFARMAARFQTIVAERQRPGAAAAEARELHTFHCAREAAELPQKTRAASLVWGFCSLIAFGIAMLTWRGRMSGPWNPGIILGAVFAVAAVVTFALSFRIRSDSWWREMAGLDDQTLKSMGFHGRRQKRRVDA